MIHASAGGRDGLGWRPEDDAGGFVRYTLFSTIVTALTYSLGYSTIGFGLLFLGALWSLTRHRRFPWLATPPLDLPLAVFGALLVASALLSPYHRLAGGVTAMLIISSAVYFGAFTSVLHAMPEGRTPILRAWAFGAAIASAVGLAFNAAAYRFVGTGAMTPSRAEIPRGVGPNGLGTTLMLGSVLSFGLAFRTRGVERYAWIAGGLFCLVGLLASGSRASVAGWVLGAAYLAWRHLRARPIHLIAVAAAGLALLVAIELHTPQIANRVRYTLRDVSGNRVKIWHASLAMIASHPLLGTGFGTFERAYDEHRGPGTSPEPFAFNLWLNLAVETGLLGLAGALAVAVAAFRVWRRRGRGEGHDPWRPVIAALWVALLVDQFADNTLFSISTSAALWLMLALLVVPSESAPAGSRPD